MPDTQLVPFAFRQQTGPIPLSELDSNFSYVSGKLISVKDSAFGAIGDDVTDDTDAFVNAITYCNNNGLWLYVPDGRFVITRPDALVLPDGFTIFGCGKRRSVLVFRPTAPGACVTASNGASRVNQLKLSGLGFYSDDTSTFKVALDLYDLSVCIFSDVMISGSGGSGPSAGVCWTGADSIGIRTHGREATGWKDIEVVADYPLYIDANPNTDPDDLEDMDHWNWNNCYFIANGHAVVTVNSGIGLSHVSFDGYQAWVGGVGGFVMSDTRNAGGTIPSRNISFKNVRYEQCEVQAAYAFQMTFSVNVQQVLFENHLISSTSAGYYVNGYDNVSFKNITAATPPGTVALLIAGTDAGSTVTMENCIWPTGTTVTLTDLIPTMIAAYRSADFQAPNTATYTGQITGSAVNAETVQVTGGTAQPIFIVVAATGDGFRLLPQAAGSGAVLEAVNNPFTDFEPIQIIGETISLRYRTGVATSDVGIFINASGQVQIPALAGVGTRNVVVDASGNVSAP